MNLEFLGTTSKNGACPNLYATDDSYVVQGRKINEATVEIPAALLDFVPTGHPDTVDSSPALRATGGGTYIVQGETVTDPAALATLHQRGLPDHEAAVAVPRSLFGSG